MKILIARLLRRWAERLAPSPKAPFYEMMKAEVSAGEAALENYKGRPHERAKQHLFRRLADGLAQSKEVEKFMYYRDLNGTTVTGVMIYFKHV